MEEQEDLTSYLQRLDKLDLPEQNTSLVLSNFSINAMPNGLYLIIGNECYFRHGINYGRLMAGLMRFQKREIDGNIVLERQVVIPFSSRLLFIDFKEDGSLDLICTGDRHRQIKNIRLDDNGNVSPRDIAFVFDEECVDMSLLKESFLVEVPVFRGRA